MKRTVFYAIGFAIAALAACTPQNQPTPEPEVNDSIFPKKHLIEEFTGQDCGYCPGGMDAIEEFIGNDSNWVLVLHHYGYKNDHFTIAGSSAIGSTLGVAGAPQVCINRQKTKSGEGSKILFKPGYLPTTTSKTQFETTTYASIVLNNDYNPSTRQLTVKVSGIIAPVDHAGLKLTVLVKESGMIDYQQDYDATFEGWQEFRHANAVRVFLTDAKGDAIEEDAKRRYSAEYSTTLEEGWVPENCMVVAFLTEAFKPVIQAEEKPVVDGTKGGADLSHEGITRVPVSDYYPEPNATDGPAQLSGKDSVTLSTANAYYTAYPNYGFNFWEIQAYDLSSTVTISRTICVPFASIYLFTATGQTAISQGSYELNTSMEPGTAYAGFRDDEKYYIGGSQFYFVDKAYLQQGYLVPAAEWLIAEGTMTVNESSWAIEGKAWNGSAIRLIGTSAITNRGKGVAPHKLHKK